MVIFVLVIAGASSIFTGLLTQFKQQSKIAETNIEGAVGLEILRRDLESAGYGLAWNVEIDNAESPGDGNDWEQLVGYCEAVSDASITPNPTTFNNGCRLDPNPTLGVTLGLAPQAIFSGNNIGLNGADYLVIRSTAVATNDAAHKWTYLRAGNNLNTWTPACENLNKYPTAGDTNCSTGGSTENTVRVIVISPGGSTDANTRSLITSSATAGRFYTQYNNTYPNNTQDFDPPAGSTESYIVYGVDRDTNLRMPFNRADYYVRRPAGNAMPSQCAPNTGVLYKATVNHADGGLTELPVLDCVADMQVVYERDTGGPTSDLTGLNAQDIRTQVKEVWVYILAHEGQRDPNYISPNPILVGPDTALGRNVDVSANINYRWKVYPIVVKTNNLR